MDDESDSDSPDVAGLDVVMRLKARVNAGAAVEVVNVVVVFFVDMARDEGRRTGCGGVVEGIVGCVCERREEEVMFRMVDVFDGGLFGGWRR